MNWLRFAMAWHVVVVGSGLWASAQDPVFRSDDEAEAASVMQAFAANMLALECFDMSMTYEKSHVATEDRSAMQSNFRWRYICDFRAGVHLVVGSQRVHQFSLESDDESRQRQFLGVFVNAKEKESWVLSKGGTSGMDLRGKDAEAIDRWALHWAGYPDPRLVGSTPFPQPFIGNTSIQELFHMSVFPKSKMILQETAETDRAEIIKTPGPQDSGRGMRARYLMDMER